MTIASRTPEGQSNRCPVCQANVRIEPSVPYGDAPYPQCGHLLWFVRTPSSLLVRDAHSISEGKRELFRKLSHWLGVPDSESHHLQSDLVADSIDIVELVIDFEDEFKINNPDEAYGRIRSIDDLIEYLIDVDSENGD